MELIDKAALVSEIERKVKSINSCPFRTAELGSEKFDEGQLNAYNEIISYIGTLEVEEVDFEKEIDNQIRLLGGVHTLESGTNWYKGPYSELVFFAKHFFELGLKVQKGE